MDIIQYTMNILWKSSLHTLLYVVYENGRKICRFPHLHTVYIQEKTKKNATDIQLVNKKKINVCLESE